MSMMMEIFSNQGEDTRIRQAALVVLSSWGPKPSFWFQLARSTWREPSKQMTAYITTFIESMVESKGWDYIGT